MLIFGRKQQNSVKQLSFNFKKWKKKENTKSKTFQKKRKTGRFTLLDTKSYYKHIRIKILQCWHRNRKVGRGTEQKAQNRLWTHTSDLLTTEKCDKDRHFNKWCSVFQLLFGVEKKQSLTAQHTQKLVMGRL